ncbi:hypothetical protein LLH00_10305 [bacterium]|nr:hypothetical protein [bacterium]
MSRNFLKYLAGVSLLSLGLAVPAVAARVAVVASDDYAVFRRAASGFWDYLSAQDDVSGPLEDSYIVLDGDVDHALERLRRINPELVLALGNNAARTVHQQLRDVPMVFAVVSDPVRYGIVDNLASPGTLLSGVSIDIPVELKIDMLLRVIGPVKTIGTIYSPGEIDRIETLKQHLSGLGIAFSTRLVHEDSDIIRAAHGLGQIDLFWMVSDPAIYTPSNRELLFGWLRGRGVPILTPAEKFLAGRNGGDLAIAIDPDQSGRQAGRIAARFLQHASISQPVQSPSVDGLLLFVKKRSGLRVPANAIPVE